ncbi:ankyrin repeat domain-containing protein [Rickettsiales bacterium]|nr:ankyrin repeat domain-containing protein [Rickettsiales bacterium]
MSDNVNTPEALKNKNIHDYDFLGRRVRTHKYDSDKGKFITTNHYHVSRDSEHKMVSKDIIINNIEEALAQNNYMAAEFLLQKNTYKNALSLFWPISYRNKNMIKLLLSHGANINYQDPQTLDTPMHYVARLNINAQNTELGMFLIKRGANPYVKNARNRTAMASVSSQFDAVKDEELLNKRNLIWEEVAGKNPNKISHSSTRITNDPRIYNQNEKKEEHSDNFILL